MKYLAWSVPILLLVLLPALFHYCGQSPVLRPVVGFTREAVMVVRGTDRLFAVSTLTPDKYREIARQASSGHSHGTDWYFGGEIVSSVAGDRAVFSDGNKVCSLTLAGEVETLYARPQPSGAPAATNDNVGRRIEISPDNRIVYFTASRGKKQFVTRFDTVQRAENSIELRGNCSDLEVNPEANLAYWIDHDNYGDVRLMEGDMLTSRTRALVLPGLRLSNLSLSPDATRLLLSESSWSSDSPIYMVDVSEWSLRELPASGEEAAWQTNEKILCFRSGCEIWQYDLPKGERQCLFGLPWGNDDGYRAFYVSKDGTWLYCGWAVSESSGPRFGSMIADLESNTCVSIPEQRWHPACWMTGNQ